MTDEMDRAHGRSNLGTMNSRLLIWALLICLPALAAGRDPLSAPNWDHSLAAQTAQVPASHARVDELFSLLAAGDRAALESRLDAIIAGRGLTEPARDFILFRFAVGLADFDAVDPGVIARLRAVSPTVLVPHPDQASVGVPLFNIAGAAEGVRHLGMRRQARNEARRALGASPETWINAFLDASSSERDGFADALDEAPSDVLADLLDTATAQPSAAVELTPVIGKSALLLGDTHGLEFVVRHGGGSDLARILEAAGRTLPGTDSRALLQSAISGAPAANASLAIAQLYPPLADDPVATDLLFATLGNGELGPAAAMALAALGGTDVRAALQQVAEEEDGLAAARARSALALQAFPGDRQ